MRKTMNFFLVAAIFFAGVPAIAVAETNTIRGKIIDASTGEEIIGAYGYRTGRQFHSEYRTRDMYSAVLVHRL